MASYSTNEIRTGLKVMIDNGPCEIIENEFHKPGKGQAIYRVKFRNLKTGRVLEKSYRSGETLEAADIVEKELQYLYADDEFLHFMDPQSFEQLVISIDLAAESKQWIKEQDTCAVLIFNGNPISITPSTFVTLKVTETDPGVRGDTVTGGNKPATLETGAVIKVPLFIDVGDTLKIDTRTGEYVSRVKD